MPLPEKVIEQIGQEHAETQGWALGILFFSGGMLFIALMIYFGLAFGYEPYLQSQLSGAKDQVAALDQAISPSDQSQLINFYSQIANLQSLLQNHTLLSQFFLWLENNTEANVYYQSFTLATGGRVEMKGIAKTEADVNQQIAILENSPEVSSVVVSSVNAPPLLGGAWEFSMTLVMNPSLFLASSK